MKRMKAESTSRAEEVRRKLEEHDVRYRLDANSFQLTYGQRRGNADIKLLMQERDQILQAIEVNNHIEMAYQIGARQLQITDYLLILCPVGPRFEASKTTADEPINLPRQNQVGRLQCCPDVPQ